MATNKAALFAAYSDYYDGGEGPPSPAVTPDTYENEYDGDDNEKWWCTFAYYFVWNMSYIKNEWCQKISHFKSSSSVRSTYILLFLANTCHAPPNMQEYSFTKPLLTSKKSIST